MLSFPFFHWPTFTAQIQSQLYRTDRAFYSATMAVCAITSARFRDGVPLPNNPGPHFSPASEDFYDACLRAIPKDIAEAEDFNYKRAKAVLGTLCIQYGRVKSLHTHLGDYLTMCANDGFHNEARWPMGLSEIEVQERRRLVSPTRYLGIRDQRTEDIMFIVVLVYLCARHICNGHLGRRHPSSRIADHSPLPRRSLRRRGHHRHRYPNPTKQSRVLSSRMEFRRRPISNTRARGGETAGKDDIYERGSGSTCDGSVLAQDWAVFGGSAWIG